MINIQIQKLLYHITDINNLPSILKNGLIARANITGFEDIADHDILKSRKKLNLARYVPFHFFAQNPFEGRVQKDHPQKEFILITIRREVAAKNGWKIVPKHPLAGNDLLLLDYKEGLEAIDWDKMNERDYANEESKSICMAECLSPNTVSANSFFNIYVKSKESKSKVVDLLKECNLSMHVDVNEGMFLK